MKTENFQASLVSSMEDAFPDVDPQMVPFGSRVLVQIQRIAKKTTSGILLVEDTRETVKWNMQVARVVAMGPLAFKNRETAQPWPEGQWAKVGDFVRVPRWDGDRVEIPVKDGDPVVFVLFNDTQLMGRITGNPLEQRTYIL